MAHGNSSSATASAPTSGSAGHKLSESEFLARQAGDAKAAMARVLDDMKCDLGHGIDPRGWVEAAPWTTLGVTAVSAFVAASLAVPSKEQQTLRRLRKIERALHHESGNGHHREESGAPEGRSMLASILGQVLGAIQPVITGALGAAFSAKAANQQGNGDGSQQVGRGI